MSKSPVVILGRQQPSSEGPAAQEVPRPPSLPEGGSLLRKLPSPRAGRKIPFQHNPLLQASEESHKRRCILDIPKNTGSHPLWQDQRVTH